MAIHTLASASKPQRPGQCWRQALLIPTLAMGLLDPSQLLGRPALAAAGDTAIAPKARMPQRRHPLTRAHAIPLG